MTIAKSLKGSTGAVKDIVHVKGSNLAICCGYDRFLRVFDYKTNEDLPQIYLKNKLNVVFPYDVKVESESDNEDNSDHNEELEDEDLFEEGEDEEGEDDVGENYEEEGFEDEDDFEVIDEEDVDPDSEEKDDEEMVIKSKKNSKKNKK